MTRHAFRALILPAALAGMIPTAPVLARAAHAAAAHDEASLIATEDAFFAAQISHDFATVDASLGDELVYCHANGRRETRGDHLAALRDGHLDYRRIDPSDRVVHVYGDVGTSRANLTMQVGERTMKASVLGVYAWRDGRWQLVSWQTTPLPDA
ncbi:nuclear transport factor 2 family protein [Novosphingobium sp. BL-8A]|uniref:nuclear transport factor 2 family protein n=1 Tax=Novosphingobium sp. BL-8A TaxID=3127639 RepID=UPI0037573759